MLERQGALGIADAARIGKNPDTQKENEISCARYFVV
jgi:hypothetical protein